MYSTINSVLRNKCCERQPVLKDPVSLAKGTRPQTTFAWPIGSCFKIGSAAHIPCIHKHVLCVHGVRYYYLQQIFSGIV